MNQIEDEKWSAQLIYDRHIEIVHISGQSWYTIKYLYCEVCRWFYLAVLKRTYSN